MNVSTPIALAPAQRFARLEDPVGDFPFYGGAPKALSGWQWLYVLAAVAVGFLVLALPIPWPGGPLGALIPALLFPLIPLAALAHVAPGHWKVIFGRVRGRELKLMLGLALLNLVVSMSVGAAVRVLADVTPNAATAQLGAMDTTGRIAFFAKTLPQLLGEEVVTVLPFLAVLTVLSRRFGVSRKRAIVGAWLASSLFFALIHLPTYGWKLLQCIVIIGTARMVLTAGWVLTKNIWVSTGAHVINDWLLFSMGLVGAGLANASLAGAGVASTAGAHAPPATSLAGTRWQLVSIQSMDDTQGTVRPAEPARYTLEFGTDGRVAVRLDCNRGSSTWHAEPAAQAEPQRVSGQLEFGPLAMTRAMCPPDSLAPRLASSWPYVRSYLIEAGRLHLSLMADGGILDWEPIPGT